MTESMLHGLMRLFAILASIRKESSEALSVNFVESFLKLQFSQNLVEKSLQIFSEYLEELSGQESKSREKRISLLSVKILAICDQINREMHVRNKYFILITLIQFSRYFDDHSISDDEFRHTITDAVQTIANGLLIDNKDFANCLSFITGKFYSVPDRSALLVINSEKSVSFSNINHLYRNGLDGNIYVLQIRQGGLYIFYYTGDIPISISNKVIYSNHIYIFPKGGSIKYPGLDNVYFSDVVTAYLKSTRTHDLVLEADAISHQYRNSDNGIKPMSFKIESGKLMAIMGGSGTGKSTLLRMLSGSLPLHTGTIKLNGHVLDSTNPSLRGLIGYIPQDDLLIEELTVYENLYYSARLSLGHLNENEIKRLVLKTLNTLDLLYIRELKVGSAFSKLISGGQRKRLNIALELIREPLILFADEPTSGLSSTDSEKVIQLLKDQALLGRIVIINIHQPSSELYKMLDSLLILDKGGYPVYYGNPMEAFSYLKNTVMRIDASEIECSQCGNVQTDELLKVIESNQVDQFGEYIGERIVTPSEWYIHYRDNFRKVPGAGQGSYPELPELKQKRPNVFTQFRIYSIRNFLAKLGDHQYLLFAGMIAPVLALILGFFTKYVRGTRDNPMEYIFSQNENLPAYIFMSVIVALFIGLIISSEEIIKDRKILARESFLNLSRFSYLNSKIIFLFGMIAIQMLILVLIGNNILKIRGLTFSYWLVLFSTAAFAVMLGLNISSAFKSVVAIYINIPFILVPLILLSGVIVKYDKLHYAVSSPEVVPVVGDLMASRWAYEALTVTQFRNNNYEKYFFDIDKQTANVKYRINYLIPELLNQLDDIAVNDNSPETRKRRGKAKRIIYNSLKYSMPRYPDKEKINLDDPGDIISLKNYLERNKENLIRESFRLTAERDRIVEDLLKNSETDLLDLKKNNYNESLADLVLNTNELRKIQIRGDRIIRRDSPIFHDPESRLGRAQFYSSTKRVGPYLVDTLLFNTVVLWLMSILLYIALINNWLSKLVNLWSREIGIKIKISSTADTKELND